MYQTNQNGRNELEIGKFIADQLGLKFIQTPPETYYDGLLIDSVKNVRGVLEVKRRHCNHDTYPTLIIDAIKLGRSIWVANMIKGCDFYVAIGWDDAIGWIKVPQPPYDCKHGGLRQPRDPHDKDIVAHLPIEDFEIRENR